MCKYPPSDHRGPHHWASAELHRTFCQGQINAASRESTSSDARALILRPGYTRQETRACAMGNAWDGHGGMT